MTASKDSSSLAPPPRPLPTSLNAVPMKPNHHRHNSSGAPSSTHRVTRRKSMSNGTNLAAVAQAVKEAADAPFALSALQAGLARSIPKAGDRSQPIPGYPSPPSSLPTAESTGMQTGGSVPEMPFPKKMENYSSKMSGSAIADGHSPEAEPTPRNRRASEGTRAVEATGTKPGGKTSRVRTGAELKCDKCGKGYKHSSCLTKHLWEHTPEWSYTSKLLISKHQQVQLLEAASILVAMNPATTPPASSSGASNNDGNSSANDSSSSDDTTPPPPSAGLAGPTPRGIRNGAGKPGKRYSSGSYSRSYQSAVSGGQVGSASPAATFPTHLQRPSGSRPRAGSSVGAVKNPLGTSPALYPVPSAEDDMLASAVELLSCSFHTPVRGQSVPGGNVPRGVLAEMGSPQAGGRSYVGPLNGVAEMKKEEDDDIDMEDLGERRDKDEDDDDEWARRGKSEEDEDGVFGMEE